LKIIDKYLIKEYIGPFLVSFMIALFVLLMQTVWVYIDDIMGKGAGILFISEMIFYLSIYLIPMALVIGVLISSVMSMGNLAEKYELSSMKSAGVSVFRVMLPLVLICSGLAGFSYFSADVLSPWAKLKYNARLYDIRRQPTMALEEGVFSESLPGYSMRIGKKDSDKKTIHDIMIYQQNSISGSLSEMLAKKGEMYSTPDKLYIMMRLEDGKRYENLKDDGKRRFAFLRTDFKEWNKIFVLDELDRTDDNLFRNSATTKTVSILYSDIDSLAREIERRKDDFSKSLDNNYTLYNEPVKKDSSVTININQNVNTNTNSSSNISTNSNQNTNSNTGTNSSTKIKRHKSPWQPTKVEKIEKEPARTYLDHGTGTLIEQVIVGELKNMGNLSNTFVGYKRPDIIAKAKATASSIQQQAANNVTVLDKVRETQAKHICEMHSKFVYAALCVIFLFIGAPMGAIVRKGGFGYPVLIAIGFFIAFIFMYIMFRKLGEQGTLPAAFSVWLPALILSVVGAFLTYKAMRDERVFNGGKFAFIANFFKKVFKKSIKAT
jgi:lipopolysaccharide export system permease protein